MGYVLRCRGSAGFVTPTPEERRCPQCGRMVEIWSDEQKATCLCGFVIHRDRTPSCAEWCPAGERCLGDIVDVKAIRQAATAARAAVGAEDARRRVEAIAARLAGRRAAFQGHRCPASLPRRFWFQE